MLQQLKNLFNNYFDRQDHFTQLPDEILMHIFKNLSPAELAKVSIVSKKFNRIAKDERSSLFFNLNDIQKTFFQELTTLKDISINLPIKTDIKEETMNKTEEELSNILLRKLGTYKNAKRAYKHSQNDGKSDLTWYIALFKTLKEIIYLLEQGTNLHIASSLNNYVNKKITPLDYVEENKEKMPELLTLLTEYNKFQTAKLR